MNFFSKTQFKLNSEQSVLIFYEVTDQNIEYWQKIWWGVKPLHCRPICCWSLSVSRCPDCSKSSPWSRGPALAEVDWNKKDVRADRELRQTVTWQILSDHLVQSAPPHPTLTTFFDRNFSNSKMAMLLFLLVENPTVRPSCKTRLTTERPLWSPLMVLEGGFLWRSGPSCCVLRSLSWCTGESCSWPS